MFVNEIFPSIQGECLRQGAATTFIRFAGCPLHCSYCDTPYAQKTDDGTEMNVSAIVERVRALPIRTRFVCLTGGEPLIQSRAELVDLIRQLHRWFVPSPRIAIETSGAVAVDWLLTERKRGLGFDLTLDYKLPSSGVNENMVKANYLSLEETDVIKFVCSNVQDAYEAILLLRSLVSVVTCKATIFFHAVGGGGVTWLPEYLLKDQPDLFRRFDIRYGIQLHKLLWGDERGR